MTGRALPPLPAPFILAPPPPPAFCPHAHRPSPLFLSPAQARRFVPPGLHLVEAFGYTLGGLFLARYDESPAGRFDEMVALAGLVWNPPTSCAWAGRVYVDR